MSAGAFGNFRYLSDTGEIHNAKLQPETLALTIGGTANAETAGAVTSPFAVAVSRSANGYGLKPRKATIRFTATPPTGYKAEQTYSIPIMEPSLWSTALPGTVCEYLGVAGVVVSSSSEDIR